MQIPSYYYWQSIYHVQIKPIFWRDSGGIVAGLWRDCNLFIRLINNDLQIQQRNDVIFCHMNMAGFIQLHLLSIRGCCTPKAHLDMFSNLIVP